MAKVRLDTLLAQRGLFASRSRAAASVMAGEVRLGPGGERAAKPGQMVRRRRRGRRSTSAPRFVSRGGRQARQRARRRSASTSPGGGASTSAPRPAASPTACCSAGAAHVVALDVAYGELRLVAAQRRARDRARARQRARAGAGRPARTRPTWSSPTSRSSRWRRCCPAVLACARRALRRAGDGQAAVRGRARAGRQGRRRARRRRPARRRSSRSRAARARAGRGGARLRLVGPARARRATARRSCGWPRRAAPARWTPTCDRGGRVEVEPHDRRTRTATVLTHARPAQTAEALRRAASRGRASAGVRAALRRRGDAQARARRRREGLELDAPLSDDVDLCVVARRRRHDPARAAALRGHERAGVRRELRRGRLPGDDRPRRASSDGVRAGVRAATSRC